MGTDGRVDIGDGEVCTELTETWFDCDGGEDVEGVDIEEGEGVDSEAANFFIRICILTRAFARTIVFTMALTSFSSIRTRSLNKGDAFVPLIPT